MNITVAIQMVLDGLVKHQDKIDACQEGHQVIADLLVDRNEIVDGLIEMLRDVK